MDYAGLEKLKMTAAAKKPRLTKRRRELIFYCLVLALPLTQFCVFYLGVNINSILLAFQYYNYDAGAFGWTGFSNFEMFFKDMFSVSVLQACFSTSMWVYLSGVFIEIPVTLLFSYYIYKKGFLAGTFKVIVFLPVIIPGIVMVLMYKYFVEAAVPNILEKLFNYKLGMSYLYNTSTAPAAIIIFLLWSGFGTGMVLYTSAMSRIPDSVTESARIDGAGHTREFFSVVLPMIYPTISMFLVLGVAGFFTSQAALFSFYGYNSSIFTYGYYFFIKVAQGSASFSDYPYAAAAGIIFTLVAAPVTLIVKYLLDKFGPTAEY